MLPLKSPMARGILVALLLLIVMVVAPAAIHGQSAGTSLWSNSDGPVRPGGTDMSSVELGVRFNVDTAGQITAIRFYKAASSTGSHTVSLWASDGRLLGQALSTSETASGWQVAPLSAPISVSPGVSYIASYHTSGYAATQDYFFVGLDSPPLHAPASSPGAGNGLFQYSSSPVLPSNSYLATNYWVDVVFAVAGTPTPTVTPTSTATVVSVNNTATPTATTGSAATSTPTSTSLPATSTPTSTSVPPTATPTLSTIQQGPPCTEIIGFSQTNEWYTPGFIGTVSNPAFWQLRYIDGGSIDQWAQGSAFIGWAPNNLVTHCIYNTWAPTTIVLNVSGEYNPDPAWWARVTQATINYIRTTYDPTVSRIYVQPVVGGPAGGMCGSAVSPPTSWVRATYNFQPIKAGLSQLLGPTVLMGADPQVRTCADYLDGIGHLSAASATSIGSAIATFYSQPPH